MDPRLLTAQSASAGDFKPSVEIKEIKTDSDKPKNLTISPLSPKSKQFLVEELKKIDSALLKPVLVAAALNMHVFPIPINQKLANLQLVYKEQQENNLVATLLQQAIVSYVESELLIQLQEYLKKPTKEEDWNSAFLIFLSKQLKINIDEEPLVETEIQDGKIYWRIKQGETVLYDRQQIKGKAFNFSSQACRMPWQLFRTFKDSGKRSSSVAITQELFVAQFTDSEKFHAAQVWQELKDVGILNSRNRLSHGWRSLCDQRLYLTLKTVPQSWGHQKVLDVIHLLTNSDSIHTEERIPGIPGARIYRPERAKKAWAMTGRITNNDPTSETARMNIWDVATYLDATAHHDNKLKISLDDKITYDHVPSGCVLREEFKKTSEYNQSEHYQAQITYWEQQLKILVANYDQNFNQHKLKDPTVTTRHQFGLCFPEMKAKFDEEQRKLKEHIKKLKSEKDSITEEDNKWWTIAIPVKFHKQGRTFLESKEEQKKASEPPFLREIKSYLDILETRGKEFFLNPQEEYIKALGAFRYLYRLNVKPHQNIAGQYSIGRVPQTLFQDPNLRRAIDQLITERMKRFLEKREGSIHSIA